MLGLMAIKATTVFRKMSIELFASAYVSQLLERDDTSFKINPKKNMELIRRLREKASLFENLIVQVGSKEQLQQTMDIAKTVVNTGIASDSGTIAL